jgi:hypothetical protein
MPPNKAWQIKQKWGIKGKPFPLLSKGLTPEEQVFVFTGRDEDLEEFCSYTERPGGLLLYGLHGAGKTLFLQCALATLEKQDCFCVYISFNQGDGFINAVLLAFLKKLCEKQPEWEELYLKLLGQNVKISRESTGEKSGELGIAPLKATAKATTKQTENIELNIANPRRWLQDLIEEQKQIKGGRPVILAIDDLDNQENFPALEETAKGEFSLKDVSLVEREARQLINAGATIILVGHISGPTAALGSSNILDHFPLEPLDPDDLAMMVKRYLALARADGKRELKFDPFTAKATQLIANTVTRLRLPTRYMLFACFEIFEYCAKNGIEIIDEQAVRQHWPNLTKHLLGKLKPEDIHYLQVIEKYGGYDEDNDSAINEIAGPFGEFLDGLKKLHPMRNEGLLIENAKGTLKLNPLLATQNPFDPNNALPEPDDMDTEEV